MIKLLALNCIVRFLKQLPQPLMINIVGGSCRGEIVDAIQHNQVVLVAGETGCGKTTQLPQYILEDAWSELSSLEESCQILCSLLCLSRTADSCQIVILSAWQRNRYQRSC